MVKVYMDTAIFGGNKRQLDNYIGYIREAVANEVSCPKSKVFVATHCVDTYQGADFDVIIDIEAPLIDSLRGDVSARAAAIKCSSGRLLPSHRTLVRLKLVKAHLAY